MTHQHSFGSPEGQSALGSLIGLRRPRYDVLDEVLAPFLDAQTTGEDLYVFINLNSALRQLFSEYTVAKLTRGELNRHPRVLAAELVNLAGHYRNYAWKMFNKRTTVLLYHSTCRCDRKIAVSADYKERLYAKRLGPVADEYEVIRRYVAFNLLIARELFDRVPHMHLVDTGQIDPEAWPETLLAAGRVPGPSLILSSWNCDLAYAARPAEVGSGRGIAVIKAAGDHTRVITHEGVFLEALRGSKTAEALSSRLDPGHFPYVLTLAGEEDLGVRGIQKVGMSRAAKLVADRVAEGRLPPDAPSLGALLEDGKIAVENHSIVEASWRLLVHTSHAAEVQPAEEASIDAQLVNRSGIGELEQANAKYFHGSPVNLEMCYAGETY
jgi:hypothetical protein